MKILLVSLLALVCSSFCSGFQFSWFEQLPLVEDDEQDTSGSANQNTVHKLTNMINNNNNNPSSGKQHHLSFAAGKNCGSEGKGTAIYVSALEIPDPVRLGGNDTFSGEVEVKKTIASPTLLKVLIVKDGVGEIPCTGKIGSCSYPNPCDLLSRVVCPKEIRKLGWNCRCPLLPLKFMLPPMTVPVPAVPLPAFLVDGKYTVKAQLFAGDEELFCYQISVSVKEV